MADPMTEPQGCQLKAFAVTEEDEGAGGIIYAKHNIVARRVGANEYAGGEIAYVSCRRAPWADKYAETALPVSVMIENGWHFECAGCGRKIDSDFLWETDRLPEDVIGHQHSAAYCDAVCEAHDALDKAQRKKLETRWLRRFTKIVKRRFPDLHPYHAYAYASRRPDGQLSLRQVAVEFDFPGREHSMARLQWRKKDSWEKTQKKPHYTCSAGDKEAFETYAAAGKEPPQRGDGG